MKVLVTYFSQSGNTEKIAKAIYEEAAKASDADLKKLDELTPDMVAEYDCIFMGSPLHSGSLAAPVKECLAVLKSTTGQQMAGFITHMAPAYPEQDMEAFTEPMKAACKEKGIEYKGCFDCQGFLDEAMHGPVQNKLNMDDNQWADMVKKMTGRPNQEDVGNAKAFVKELFV
ncbi:putative flavodoxin family protein [Desulforapulum autotrophicum HRM2]|uniref:Flavodoxin family protein n=1 Tax=Desulforapulum autotrophicum (strain ATCC 43914 / DSM 3382 / VKM B-1955 / HRM2) TaxID=177437 RepID=C0Q947_DESAH|nr:flavodoxin family protein [Desulforapulum autotrophicum]ACN16552.1 putative flavodoxin family protein [Desulforapulum autotrophicum HRM2]